MKLPFVTALLVLTVMMSPAVAQVTIAPESPRWGETIAITADPARIADKTERVYPGDSLYAVVYARHATYQIRVPLEVALTWDGRQFFGRATIPEGCEIGTVVLHTTERVVRPASAHFMCRKPDGSLPPGARIEGLAMGIWDKSNWQTDIADDLAAMRQSPEHGWEYEPAWRFSWREANTTPADQVRDVERVDRNEGEHAGPALLGALVLGYGRAGEPRKAFDKFKTLCDRFPESPFALAAIAGANLIVLEHPEFEGEFGERLAQLAKAAPQNPALRNFADRLATKTAAVSLDTLRTMAERWLADQPSSIKGHFILATVLARTPDHAKDAEEEIGKAIELSLRPHAFDADSQLYRQRAFRLRSDLRARRGDLVSAIEDARMAQLLAQDKFAADDLSTEAELWGRLRQDGKSEMLAVQALALGSLKAETVLKHAYEARTGSGDGFQAYLIDQLRLHDHPTELRSEPVPAFSATTLAGAPIDVASLLGRVTVVDFWFTTCVPCRAERPRLNELVTEFGDRVRFLGFALDKPDSLKRYLAATPFNYEIIPESQRIAESFGVSGYPHHVIIDSSGQIVWRAVPGGDGDRIEQLRLMILRVLARNEKGLPNTVRSRQR